MVKYTGKRLVVKRPGVLSKVQMLNLVLGVGVSSPLPSLVVECAPHPPRKEKTHKHAQTWGILPGTGWGRKCVYMFFGVIPTL